MRDNECYVQSNTDVHTETHTHTDATNTEYIKLFKQR